MQKKALSLRKGDLGLRSLAWVLAIDGSTGHMHIYVNVTMLLVVPCVACLDSVVHGDVVAISTLA